MAEEQIEVVKKPYSKEKIGVTIMLVGLTAAIFLAIGYWAGRQTAMLEEDKTTTLPIIGTITSTATPKATTTTSATDKTANWKTYTNEKYGFSFKYPETWKVHDFPTDQGSVQRMSVEPDNKARALGSETFSINITDLSKEEKTFDEFIQENFQQLKDDELNGINVKSTINPSIAEHIEYIIQSGNYVITIATITEEESRSTSDIETANLIANTFELTK